jgi:hypothetical protein
MDENDINQQLQGEISDDSGSEYLPSSTSSGECEDSGMFHL